MGTCDFTEYHDGASLEQAFSAARAEAAHEHGHGGYTGTIAEKPGAILMHRTPVSMAEAYAMAHQFMEAEDERINDKWGDAGAIPVITGKRSVLVAVPAGYNDEWSWPGYKSNGLAPAVTDLLKAKKLLKRGEKVTQVSLTSYTQADSRQYYGSSRRQRAKFRNGQARITIQDALAPTERKVKVSFVFTGKVTHENKAEWEPIVRGKTKLGEHEKIINIHIDSADAVCKTTVESNSKVKAQVRYVIPRTKHETWENGFDTQAQARASALQIAEDAPTTGWNAIEELHVIGVTRREGGLPLVTVKRETKKTLAVAEVTVLKTPPRPNAQPDGYLFFGWASS